MMVVSSNDGSQYAPVSPLLFRLGSRDEAAAVFFVGSQRCGGFEATVAHASKQAWLRNLHRFDGTLAFPPKVVCACPPHPAHFQI